MPVAHPTTPLQVDTQFRIWACLAAGGHVAGPDVTLPRLVRIGPVGQYDLGYVSLATCARCSLPMLPVQRRRPQTAPAGRRDRPGVDHSPRPCTICGKPFAPRNSLGVTCGSPECRRALLRNREREQTRLAREARLQASTE